MNFKLRRALLVGLLLLSAALRPAAAESPTLLRAALLVEDASRSMAFYELLGFRVEMDQANPRKAEGNPFPLNAPSSAVRLVIMQSDSGAGGRIGLVEFSRPTPAEARRDPERTGRGDLGRQVLRHDPNPLSRSPRLDVARACRPGNRNTRPIPVLPFLHPAPTTMAPPNGASFPSDRGGAPRLHQAPPADRTGAPAKGQGETCPGASPPLREQA